MKNGIYNNLSNEEYHASAGISSSSLKTIHKASPLHSRVGFSSQAMDLGTATHTAILEPHKFEDEVVVMPKFDKRKKDDKAALEAWLEEHGNKLAISQDDMDKCLAMRDSVAANAEWSNLLNSFDAQVEHSAYADIKGHQGKCRPDWYSASNSLIIDLKTTKDAHPRLFAYDFKKYQYDMSVPWYSEIWTQAGGGDVDQFLFLAVESKKPFDFTIHELSPNQYQAAFEKCLKALDKLINAQETGVYEGYSKDVNVIEEIW